MPKTKQNLGVLSFISQKIRTAISNLFLNSILSLHYYVAVRYQSQIQYTYVLFQIDSSFQFNTYNINQPLFTIYLFNFVTTFSNFFDAGKEIESKLHSILLLT